MKKKVVVNSSFKDLRNFTQIPEYRKGIISEADSKPINATYAVNSTASFLHPSEQFLKVKRVVQISNDTRAYVLEPNPRYGTARLAYFKPGQYISITLKIGSSVVTRPYTLCCSPSLTLKDEYVIVVKKVPHGFVSNYICNNWEKGTEVIASAPMGSFTHQKLRDSRNVIGITDSQGISAFVSMAEAIRGGILDVDLTLLYTSRKKKELLLSEKLDELAEQTDKFRVIYVFSDERIPGCERGFITSTLIEKYAPSTRYSVFVCGSTQLYNRVTPQIAELKLEKKYIRYGLSGQISSPASLPDFPQSAKGRVFECKVISGGKVLKTIPCAAEETVLVALERAGIVAKSSCRSGECGFCRSRLTSGNVFIPKGIDSRRLADSKFGIIHPCCSYPMSNLTLVIN